jgi:hypothetical protein
VARFLPGATGRIDPAVLPAYDSIAITRSRGQWLADPVGAGKRRKWSEEVFVDTATELSRPE